MRYGWSLAKSEWGELPTELVNAAVWQFVQLNILEIDAVPQHAGLYVVCSLAPGRRRIATPHPNDLFSWLYAALYVGVSDNLQQRFRRHCNRPDEPMTRCMECFGESLDFWFVSLDASVIRNAEARLIDCLGPSANRIRGSLKGKALEPIAAGSGF